MLQTDGQTDRQTGDRKTALCTKMHRAVKKSGTYSPWIRLSKISGYYYTREITFEVFMPKIIGYRPPILQV